MEMCFFGNLVRKQKKNDRNNDEIKRSGTSTIKMVDLSHEATGYVVKNPMEMDMDSIDIPLLISSGLTQFRRLNRIQVNLLRLR